MTFLGTIISTEPLDRDRVQARVRRDDTGHDVFVVLDRRILTFPDPAGELVSSASNTTAVRYRFTADDAGSVTELEAM